VWRNNTLLLIERRRPPFGFAPPSGHVDDHGSFENAARAELREEVGLTSTELLLLAEGRKENKCRRSDGNWHYWKIYETKVAGAVIASRDETKSICWADAQTLRSLADRTGRYLSRSIGHSQWEYSPGLEPVWYEWLTALGILGRK
jgi:ADP-ribose pyrophosphatase YjhB (NUDIX family)